MDILLDVMWLHPKQSDIQRFYLQLLPIHGPKRLGLKIILPRVRSREIFPVSGSLNCRMGTSSPRAGTSHKFIHRMSK